MRSYTYFLLALFAVGCFSKSRTSKKNSSEEPPIVPVPTEFQQFIDEIGKKMHWQSISEEDPNEVIDPLHLYGSLPITINGEEQTASVRWHARIEAVFNNSQNSDVMIDDLFQIINDGDDYVGSIISQPMSYSTTTIRLVSSISYKEHATTVTFLFDILPLSERRTLVQIIEKTIGWNLIKNQNTLIDKIKSDLYLPSSIEISLGDDFHSLDLFWSIDSQNSDSFADYFTIEDNTGKILKVPENPINIRMISRVSLENEIISLIEFNMGILAATEDEIFRDMIDGLQWSKISDQDGSAVTGNLKSWEEINQIGFDSLVWAVYLDEDPSGRNISDFIEINNDGRAADHIATILERPEYLTDPLSVALRADFSWNQKSGSKTFYFTIPPLSSGEYLDRVASPHFLWELIRGENWRSNEVSFDLDLDASIPHITIDWVSDKSDLISDEGNVSLKERYDNPYWSRDFEATWFPTPNTGENGIVDLVATLSIGEQHRTSIVRVVVIDEPVLNLGRNHVFKGLICHGGFSFQSEIVIQSTYVRNRDGNYRAELSGDGRGYFSGQVSIPNPQDVNKPEGERRTCYYRAFFWETFDIEYRRLPFVQGNDRRQLIFSEDLAGREVHFTSLQDATDPWYDFSCPYVDIEDQFPEVKSIEIYFSGEVTGSSSDEIRFEGLNSVGCE